MPPRIYKFSSKALCDRPSLITSGLFHTGTAWKNSPVNHYETLGLEANASAASIKKQFYSLSKTHHPDLNRSDREASNRFVRISEAYAVLGNPAKRERYDRDTRASLGGPPSHVYQGSHSSSGPYGSRPASGLSRRRTQFRGPPPSFYRSGGWGAQGANRAPQPKGSATSSSVHPGTKSAESGANYISGGVGLGGPQMDWSNDVPHFDRDGHYRTQEQQELRRMKRNREYSDHYDPGGSALINFAVVGGVISLAYLISAPFENGRVSSRNKNGS